MNTFKLHPKAGVHTEALSNGETQEYKSGDIIKTERELDKMFLGKFLRLSAPTSIEPGADQPVIPVPSKFVSEVEDLDDVTKAAINMVTVESIQQQDLNSAKVAKKAK